MEQTENLYRNVNVFKRICASLIDIIVVLFLIVGLYKIVLDPLVFNFTDYNEVSEKYNQKLAKTHLFIIDGTTYQLIDKEDYATNLNYFYHTYLEEKGEFEKGKEYDKSRLDSSLFVEKDGVIYERNDVLKSSLDSFYETQYEKAVTYAKQDKELNSYAKKMNLYNYLEFFISLFLSCLAIRQASLLLVELGLSMILMFIPLFITIGMVVFSQKKIALHDYFALSYTIDDKGTLTFKTKEELEEYIKEKNKPYYQNDTYTKSAK